MNRVELVGRLVDEPVVSYAQNGSTVTRFRLAVDRQYKKEGGDTADFISCVAFGKTGEFVEKWFHKPNRMGVVGRIQTGSYTKQDGTKVYTTDVVAENVEFVESKQAASTTSEPDDDDFMNVPEGADDEGLPFN